LAESSPILVLDNKLRRPSLPPCDLERIASTLYFRNAFAFLRSPGKIDIAVGVVQQSDSFSGTTFGERDTHESLDLPAPSGSDDLLFVGIKPFSNSVPLRSLGNDDIDWPDRSMYPVMAGPRLILTQVGRHNRIGHAKQAMDFEDRVTQIPLMTVKSPPGADLKSRCEWTFETYVSADCFHYPTACPSEADENGLHYI